MKEIEVPGEFISKDRAIYLDLGDVRAIARVRLNGQDLGVLWKKPFQLDITGFARAGKNRLEVEVANLWANRLVGDEQLPDDREWNPDGSLKGWPGWMREGKQKPETGRRCWTTWRHHRKDSPLIPSGLLGPVKLLVGVRNPVNI